MNQRKKRLDCPALEFFVVPRQPGVGWDKDDEGDGSDDSIDDKDSNNRPMRILLSPFYR